jgi:Invasin, domain 3/IPT/TIG domain/Quinohemoprotein amine dehydrogenase, alpha subunit domain III
LSTRTDTSQRPPGRAAIRRLAAALLTFAVVAAMVGVLAPAALAAVGVTVTPASGGTSINDTTGGSGGAYTTLGDIVLDESNAGEIGLGTLVVKLPAGFEWRTSTTVNVAESGTSGSSHAILLSTNPASCTSTSDSVNVTPTTSTITVRVCRVSGDDGKLTFSNPQVRPSAQTPLASGNIYLDSSSTSTVVGVTAGPTGTNFGSLAMVPTTTTHLQVAGLPDPYATNSTASPTVTALDAAGNTASSYRGKIHFTSTDSAAVLPADYTFTAADNGAHTFTNGVTLKTLGSRDVTATDTASSSISGSQSGISVTAAALDHLVLSPAAATIAAGSSRGYTAEGRDAYGNDLGDLTASTTFTIAPDGSCAGASCTATAAGPHTVTGTSGAATGSAGLQVVPAVAAAVTVTVDPASLRADGSATATATATVADAYGNRRAGDTVTITSSGDVAVAAVTDNGNGSYSATITASVTPGDETITASDGDASGAAVLHEDPSLSVASVSPASRGQGANGGAWGQSITVVGDGFAAGSSVDFGPGVTVKFTTFVDAGHLVAHIAVAGDATVGSRDVTVTNPTGASATCAGCFTVNAGPSLASVAPSSIGAGGVRTVTMTGANFDASTRVTFPGTGVAVTSVTLVDAAHLSVGISSAAGAAAGPRDVVVTNADAGSGTCSGCLTVTPPPTVTAMTPRTLGPGALRTVTVDGANFASGVKVSFAGSGAAATAVTFVSDTQLQVTVSVASNATAGPRTVMVTNPDLGKSSCATCFSVSAGPQLTSVSPGTLARGSSRTVTVDGANFASGATLALGGGITVSAVNVVDPSRLTATVSVAATAATGTRTATVTNPDGGKATLSGALSVT